MKKPGVIVDVPGIFSTLIAHKKVVLGVIAVLLAVFLFDAITTSGRVYSGVRIGSVDVSGLTHEQVEKKIDETYGAKVAQGRVLIYAGEEGKQAYLSGSMDIGPEEQLSVDEVAANTKFWDVSSQDLGINVPKTTWADQALAVGRESGGIFARIGSLILGTTIKADLAFDEPSLEALGKKIDATMGVTRVDYNIAIEDGVASVTEGNDGIMIDRDVLRSEIQSAILDSTNGSGEFIAKVEKAPLRIDKKQAERVRDTVNKAIADGAIITHNSTSWSASATDLGNMVSTDIVKNGNSWTLTPTVLGESSKSTLLSHVKEGETGSTIAVTITVQDGVPSIHPNESGIIPDVSAGLDELNSALFGGDGKSAQEGAKNADGRGVEVSFGDTEAPDSMSFEDALAYGFIEKISGYTTEYNTGSGTEARVNNIHVAASELNNSVCKANGGTWSFNDIAGESTEDKGFRAAGSIIAGEYQDSIGGGVCQVATTVFNCIYESGLPIPLRHNHTLYISSYPEGRDAAVTYPEMDLVWKNDTASDIIMRTSFDDSSVTVEIYGQSPHYKIKTKTGDWQEGDKYRTTVRVDSDLASGAMYVETSGTNGLKISVTRTVTKESGEIVREDEFASNYQPKNKVIVTGPNTPVDLSSNN